jgi:hypothetical protein
MPEQRTPCQQRGLLACLAVCEFNAVQVGCETIEGQRDRFALWVVLALAPAWRLVYFALADAAVDHISSESEMVRSSTTKR